jgi:hypothetical protein
MGRIRITKWNADELVATIERRAHEAIDETTAEAAQAAKGMAPRRRGQLVSEIVSEPAQRQDGRIVGKFGSTKVRGFYGLFHERRRPFLRPAADATFPRLRERLKI